MKEKREPEVPPVVQVKNVSKWFGSIVAVSEVSFNLQPGITGLLGPNGAGKTSLIRMIAGLAKTSEGEITVFGKNLRSELNLYRKIGVMTDQGRTYEFMNAQKFIECSARLKKVKNAPTATKHALQLVNLENAATRPIRTYSRGMKQRVQLAATLVHEPELLILDEPLNGADPKQRFEFQKLLLELADKGHTILISSHVLEEVESLASRVLLVAKGKLAAEGDIRSIRGLLDERPYQVQITCNQPRILGERLIGLDSISSVQIDRESLIVLSSNFKALQELLPQSAAETGVRLTRVEPLDDSLESVFNYLVES